MASTAGYMPAQTIDHNARSASAARFDINEYKKLMHQHTQNLMRQSTRQTTAESSSNTATLRTESSTDSNSSTSSMSSTRS